MRSLTRRRFLAATALAGGAALLAACTASSGGGSTAPATNAGGATATPTLATQLNVGLGQNINDFNGFDLDIASYSDLASIYDTLLSYDANNNVVPRLAESYSIAEDGSSATIKLRPNLTFQDGEPLNAQAVVTNYTKAQDPQFAYQIYSVIPRVQNLTANDDLNLTLTMNGPTPTQVITDILDSINLMAPNAMDANALKTKGVGAGPFGFDSYTPGNQLVLKRFDGWWRQPPPSIQQLTYHISTDIDATVASLQAGALDAVTFLPPSYTTRLKDQYTIYAGPSGLEVYPFRINPGRAPFDNKMVRQGLQYAINRQGIVDKVFYGYSKPAVLPFGDSNPANDPNAVNNYPFDLQKAQQMFAAAGAPNWSAIMYHGQNDPVGDAITQIVQADLASIGCTLNVQTIGAAESTQRAFSGDYQSFYGILGNCGKYPTWVTLNSLMRVQNNPILHDATQPILDRWAAAVNQANSAVTPDQQATAFQSMRDVILDESWLITICLDQTLVAMNQKVSGVRINRDDFVVFEDVQVKA